jgi:hypothetical protein
MRAAMASNLAANALVRKPKSNQTPGDKAFERRDRLEENYSSQCAIDAIEFPPTGLR